MNASKCFISCLLLVIFLVACSNSAGLSPFSSDGCSLFPDSSIVGQKDWCGCCYAHDVAYWRGGTADERLVADQQLKECIVESTQLSWLASLMYNGVRAGGSPYIYSWFRWGYGWHYGRKYQSLTDQEHAVADSLLEEAYSRPGADICEK